MELRITRARKIYSDGGHNAFTGLYASEDITMVTFRSAATHLSIDGRIKVVASSDMENWDLIADISCEGADLRDPTLMAFKDDIFLYCAKCVPGASRECCAYVYTKGGGFGEMKTLNGLEEGDWLWFSRALGDCAYGTAYKKTEHGYRAALYSSRDALSWSKIQDFPVEGGNEVSLDFDEGGIMYALVRTDHDDCIPSLCVAEPSYTDFKVTQLPMSLNGPMIKRLEGGCVIACRQWDAPGRRNLRTDVFWLGDGEPLRFIRSLPSGGDTSYVAWADVGEGKALASYYSAHEHKMDDPHDIVNPDDEANAEHTTAADIYLADISFR